MGFVVGVFFVRIGIVWVCLVLSVCCLLRGQPVRGLRLFGRSGSRVWRVRCARHLSPLASENQFSSQSFWMTPLHVSALGGGAWRSAVGWASWKSLRRAVTVLRMRSTAVWIWSSWDSISNSMSPIFILTLMGGFCGFSVKRCTYCILYCARCTCTILK